MVTSHSLDGLGSADPEPGWLCRAITSAPAATAIKIAGHILRHTKLAEFGTARSECDADCHSRRERLDTNIRYSVRTIASADTHA